MVPLRHKTFHQYIMLWPSLAVIVALLLQILSAVHYPTKCLSVKTNMVNVLVQNIKNPSPLAYCFVTDDSDFKLCTVCGLD